MKLFQILVVFLILFSCKNSNTKETEPDTSKKVDVQADSNDLSAIVTKDFREFKILDSKYIDNVELWSSFNKDLEDFTQLDHDRLKPLILEQNIPTLQKLIKNGSLTYESLTKFYL
jgi:amidase